MLWVYGHYKYFNSFSAGTVFIRQNLTSVDVRFWRIKTVPALKGLTRHSLVLSGVIHHLCATVYNLTLGNIRQCGLHVGVIYCDSFSASITFFCRPDDTKQREFPFNPSWDTTNWLGAGRVVTTAGGWATDTWAAVIMVMQHLVICRDNYSFVHIYYMYKLYAYMKAYLW